MPSRDAFVQQQNDGLQQYEDWLATIRRDGGQFAWIWQNAFAEVHNWGRTAVQMREAVLASKRVRNAIEALSTERKVADSVVRSEAEQILCTMALDFRFHSAAQPMGYSLAKVFERIFSRILINSSRMHQIREMSTDRSVPIVWMPTHRSYLDFLLLSVLSYHYRIQLPAICAADDFRASRLLGEALRRCGAFFIRRSFKKDLLYRSIFAEYVQQHLIYGDRPMEFFVEGQRSRTAKSVFPRTGLLQIVVEPFLRAQLYDTILIPVTIDYDRILEEQLFAWELIGFSKPRENATGLLRARSILNDHFGDIRVTIGEPISIRKYFLGKIPGTLDMRLEFASQSPSEMEENIREKVNTLALKIVHLQNAQGTLTIWPIVALAILQILNESLSNAFISPPVLTLNSLRLKTDTFLCLFKKCCGHRIWRTTKEGMEDEIRNFVRRLHHSHLSISPSGDSIQFVDLSPPDSLPPLLINAILLANQANPFVHKMAPFCFGAILRLSPASSNNNYHFLQRLFDYEFVLNSDHQMLPAENTLDTSDLWSLAQILKPFFIAYHSIFTFLLIDCSNAFLTSVELTLQIHRKLVQSVRQNAKIPMQIVSTDIIKNALNSLKAFGVAKMDDENRLRIDCVELNKLLKTLEHFLISLRWFPSQTENLSAKI